MIVSQLLPKQGICSMTVESPDDLWTLRRLIAPGDVVVTRSSRVVKRESEYSRPDRGERIKVTVALAVETVSLDSSVNRLRIRGHITEASDEIIGKAGTHSLIISPGQDLTLRKGRWSPLETHILESAQRPEQSFILIAIDRREAGIGLLGGSHLSILSTVESGASGKGVKETDVQPFFRKVLAVVKESWRDGFTLVIAGPGNTKLTLENIVRRDTDLGKRTFLVEGYDLAGSDGVRGLVKFEGFRSVAKGSVLVEIQETVDEVITRISRGGRRVAYTLARVEQAATAGAVDKCVVSDDVFVRGVDEDEVVRVLNLVEDKGGDVYLCDSSLETGKQVSSLGGMAAVLRYDVAPISS